MDKLCHGVDLHNLNAEDVIAKGINLEYIIDAYRNLTKNGKQFYLKSNFFDLLMGTTRVRDMIARGMSADEIKARQRMKACDAKPEDGRTDDAFDANDAAF